MYSELGLVGNYAVVQCSYYFKVLNTPIIWIIYTVCCNIPFNLIDGSSPFCPELSDFLSLNSEIWQGKGHFLDVHS